MSDRRRRLAVVGGKVPVSSNTGPVHPPAGGSKPAAAPLGYSVAVNRPQSRDAQRWDIAGSVHADREPAENHREYCELRAADDPARFGAPVRYAVVEIRLAPPVID